MPAADPLGKSKGGDTQTNMPDPLTTPDPLNHAYGPARPKTFRGIWPPGR
jgi:hypothetical protein